MRRFFVVFTVAVLVGAFGATASAGDGRKFDVPITPPFGTPRNALDFGKPRNELDFGKPRNALDFGTPRNELFPRTTTSSGTSSPSNEKDRDQRLDDAWGRFNKAADKCQELYQTNKKTGTHYSTWDDYWDAVKDAQDIAQEIDDIMNESP